MYRYKDTRDTFATRDLLRQQEELLEILAKKRADCVQAKQLAGVDLDPSVSKNVYYSDAAPILIGQFPIWSITSYYTGQ